MENDFLFNNPEIERAVTIVAMAIIGAIFRAIEKGIMKKKQNGKGNI